MFKQLLLKSVATSAAVGTTVAMSLVATPAVVDTAPDIRTVAYDCSDPTYAGDVPTSTDLVLGRVMGRYGMPNRATATVSDGDRTPTGAVRFVAYNGAGRVVASQTVELAEVSGTTTATASWSMPRNMRARQTAAVSANYLGEDCFAASQAHLAFYTILPRITRTVVDAPNRRRAWRPKVGVDVRSYGPYEARGALRITIARNGRVVRSKRVFLRGGERTVFFHRLRPGLYDARVRYAGHRNFIRSRGADRFRVYRR